MMKTTLRYAAIGLVAVSALFAAPAPSIAEDAAKRAEVDAGADSAIERLTAKNVAASELADKAHAILVFPEITKGGLIVGMAGGTGVLRIGGKSIDYYETGGLSFGLKAGIQTYGYVLMFMTESALTKFQAESGFKLGVDASVAVYRGASTNIDTTNVQSDIIAFVFDTQGLMLDVSIEGSQYTKSDI